jgi:hypothetical protein
MKRLILSLVVLLSAVFSLSAAASPQAANQPKKIKWMFVTSAKTGTVRPLGGNGYMLELNLSDIKRQTLQYGEKPNRQVKSIAAADIMEHFRHKGAYFAEPPNVMLSSYNYKPIIAEMLQLSVKGDRFYARLQFLPGNPNQLPQAKTQLKDIVLTVDAATYHTYAACQAKCNKTSCAKPTPSGTPNNPPVPAVATCIKNPYGCYFCECGSSQ